MTVWPDTPFTFESVLLEDDDDEEKEQDNELPSNEKTIPSKLNSVDTHSSALSSVVDEKTRLLPSSVRFPKVGLLRAPSVMVHSRSILGDDTNNTTLDIKSQSLYNQILSAEFLELAVFFIVSSFWANFYLGKCVSYVMYT